MRAVFDTVYAASAALGLTSVMSPVVLGLALKDPEKADRAIHWYVRRLLGIADVRAAVNGLEYVPEGPCVLVCNHQSHFDAPLIVASIPKYIRFIGKAELFRIPVFGHALSATGMVRVERKGGISDRDALAAAVPAVQSGTSLLFFAEGSRSEDGVLRPFKKGAAVLVIQAQVPIVPLAVAGTRHILPKGSLQVRRGCRAALVIGPPIPTTGLALESRDALTQTCHTAVAGLLREAEALTQEAR